MASSYGDEKAFRKWDNSDEPSQGHGPLCDYGGLGRDSPAPAPCSPAPWVGPTDSPSWTSHMQSSSQSLNAGEADPQQMAPKVVQVSLEWDFGAGSATRWLAMRTLSLVTGEH